MSVYGSSRWNEARRGAALLLALGAGAGVAAPGDWSDGLQLHGFLSQGYVKTSDNRFFGPSDAGSWDLRELGANLSYQARPDLLLAGQVLSRTAGEMYDGSPRLDYGLVDYAPVMTDDLRLGLRLGRLKNPLGLYNDTRDVPFTRPSLFLPQSIYFDRVRNLELSSDGGGVYGDWQGDLGELSGQLYVGTLAVDDNVEYSFLGADWPGRLTTDRPWVVGRLLYELDGGRVRLALSRAVGTMEYQPGAGDFLGDGRIDVDFWILSAQYNAEDWSLTAEVSQEPIERRRFAFPAFNNSITAQGAYLQGTWRATPDWELMLRYDVAYVDKDDRDGSEQSAATGLPAHVFYAKDLTFGVRWDIDSQWMVRAEVHRVHGSSWLSNRENALGSAREDWDLFALQVSFRF